MHAAKGVLQRETLGPGYETEVVEWGPCTAYFERIAGGTTFDAYYDRCDCPHWGYIFKGKVRFAYADGHDEVVGAGEMYYVPPGHTPFRS